MTIPICPRCGQACTDGWVGRYGTITACRKCFDEQDWPLIQKAARDRAKPWMQICVLSCFILGLVVVRIALGIAVFIGGVVS